MSGKYITSLKTARQAACLTQEQAAEATGVSLESWKAYEYGERLPPNRTIVRICKALNAEYLRLEYAQMILSELEVLPDGLRIQGLSSAVLTLSDYTSRLLDGYRRLIQIAADGRIDDSEQEDFDEIKDIILGTVGAGLQVAFSWQAPAEIKKDRPVAATTKRSEVRTCIQTIA